VWEQNAFTCQAVLKFKAILMKMESNLKCSILMVPVSRNSEGSYASGKIVAIQF